MIAHQSPAQQYQRAQLATADRGRLLLLVFEGGLRFLSLAQTALEQGNVAQFGAHLGRAQAVIAELLHTLDHKAGGEIAGNLERLYHFMLDHLVEANQHKSAQHVAQVARVLEIITDAYRTILESGHVRVDAA
jgi:flagellar protein FliS